MKSLRPGQEGYLYKSRKRKLPRVSFRVFQKFTPYKEKVHMPEIGALDGMEHSLNK